MLTSNRTRELGDALRRRCLYLYIEHPTFEKEVRIIRTRCPEAGRPAGREVGRFVQALRERTLAKPPGVAETLDWTHGAREPRLQDRLEPEVVQPDPGLPAQGPPRPRGDASEGPRALVARAREEAQP